MLSVLVGKKEGQGDVSGSNHWTCVGKCVTVACGHVDAGEVQFAL